MKLNKIKKIDKYSGQENAAANVVRTQLDNIYENKENPYAKTHSHRVKLDHEGLKQYHTAWQEYYQKYYESFYSSQTDSKNTAENETKIRSEIRNKIKNNTTKLKTNKHFKPIFFGVLSILIFLVLQYSQIIVGNIYAFISPGSINPQNIVLNPISNNVVPPEPRLIIPKLNIDAPVHYDIGNDYDSQMKAMDSGIAHFAIPGAFSHPGERGNTALAGHSSSGMFTSGDYKFIFAVLEKLEPGDVIYTNYNSTRYTYIVTRKEVVKPTELDKLILGEEKPYLTLITCVPVGTANSRLLVFSEQISPNPSTAKSSTKQPLTTTAMHDSSKSLIDWLVDLFN